VQKDWAGSSKACPTAKGNNMTVTQKLAIIFSVVLTSFLFSCTPQQKEAHPVTPVESQTESSGTVEAEFTLKTIAEGGKLLYVGVGGDIDDVINPDLVVSPGTVVQIILTNGDGMVHDLFLPDFEVKTDYVRKIKDRTEITFATGEMQPGSYVYYCTLPGHRKAGQEGKLIVSEP